MSKEKEVLRFKVDLPSFQLELVSHDPSKALPELRRILETVGLEDQMIYEDFVAQELRSLFSENFASNEKLMTAVRTLLKQEEDYRVFVMELPITATIDLDNQTKQIKVDTKHILQQTMKLSNCVPGECVKQGIIHVYGQLPDEEKLRIVDHVHTKMPTAQLRAFQSDGSRETAKVECLFFGEFPEEEE